MRKLVLALLASTIVSASSASGAPADTARIIDEGMNRSQVMLTASELMDGIGPRLTNSTNMRKAEAWAVAKFQSYGLSNVHKEAFDFGRGWDLLGSSVRMVSPREIQLVAIPVAWLLKKTWFKGDPPPFVMELPGYKFPSPRNVIFRVYDRMSGQVR